MSALALPKVGDPVPPLVRTIALPDMIAYAGATWDWHKLHYDAAYLAAKQVPAPVVDGQVFGALLAEALQDWLGPQAFIRSLAFRFKNLVFAGETIRCEGEVTAVEDGVVALDLRVLVVAADGSAAKVAAAPCSAEVIARPEGA